jgi:hypothetical protein
MRRPLDALQWSQDAEITLAHRDTVGAGDGLRDGNLCLLREGALTRSTFCGREIFGTAVELCVTGRGSPCSWVHHMTVHW